MNIDQSIQITNEIEMLELLLDQDQFELLDLKETEETKELKAVYLMNDAVESFLVFRDAVVTGSYQNDYEKELEAQLSLVETNTSNGGRPYMLSVRQGEHRTTIFFRSLTTEIHLYDYGRVGHFWVKGYEYLRQMEYQIAILRNKRDFLGEEYCNGKELRLAYLAEFPPLNYCCYPAVPEKYLVPTFEEWVVTEEAIEVMQTFARKAGDRNLQRALTFYARHPYKQVAKLIAWMLHRTAHKDVVELIRSEIESAAGEYQKRNFGDEEKKLTSLLSKAKARQTILKQLGKQSIIMREEPFVISRDSIGFKVFLLIWNSENGNRTVKIETFESKDI